MRLLIVSSSLHYRSGDQLWAYGPYAREVDIWADLFAQVNIAVPCRRGAPNRGDFISFSRQNIAVVPQQETGGDALWPKLKQMLLVPYLIWKLIRPMRHADVIHVRCPGNLGLLGAIMAPLFSRYVIAKYAGQWDGYTGEPLSVRLQRAILRSWWWNRGLVTVYGEWPDQPPHVVPFFTSMMSSDQVQTAAQVAVLKHLTAPIHLLYAGRLVPLKGVDMLLRAVRLLVNQEIPFVLSILGDGPERSRLCRLVQELKLEPWVRFVGAVPYDEMMTWYSKGHVLVLASTHSEGWPKVLAEAMCHGLVCIGTDHGLVPWLLRDRGHVVPVGDVEALASCLQTIVQDPAAYERLSRAASSWAQGYSLEGLRNALYELIVRRWHINPLVD
jgi:glycosyltransferase involved in cell wall biosynthesis